jgi:hypothetical protein
MRARFFGDLTTSGWIEPLVDQVAQLLPTAGDAIASGCVTDDRGFSATFMPQSARPVDDCTSIL